MKLFFKKGQKATTSFAVLMLTFSTFMPSVVFAEEAEDSPTQIVKEQNDNEQDLNEQEHIDQGTSNNVSSSDSSQVAEEKTDGDNKTEVKSDSSNEEYLQKIQEDNELTEEAENNEQKSDLNHQEKNNEEIDTEKERIAEEKLETNSEEIFSLEKNRELAMQLMEEDMQKKSQSNAIQSRALPYTTAFINSVADAAVKNGEIYGLYPSVIIAQSILESGWGKSSLSKAPNYNLFGIKAEKGYKGDYVTVTTQEWVKDKQHPNGHMITIRANFRKYSSYTETFKDHAEFLKKTRYKNVWIENADTYKDATAALQKAGYATDPNYASMLNSLIKSYNLTQYDPKPSVSYSSHIGDIGTLKYVKDGETSGTTGRGKQMEAIKIKINQLPGLGVEYASHIENIGWTSWVNDDQLSGTTGKVKQMEAIKVKLTGSKAKNYDIYYRVHTEDYGWLGWAKNGEEAGTTGLAKQIEAIEIKVVTKGASAPGSTDRPYIDKVFLPQISYASHVEDLGWQSAVKSGQLSGTVGKNKQVEAVKITVQGVANLGIRYSSHVQDLGWMNWVENNQLSGTTGKAKQMEALKIALSDSKADLYDIYYRTHIQDYGWLGWAKNGEEAGSSGLAKQLEALEIVVVKKGSAAPGITSNHFIIK